MHMWLLKVNIERVLIVLLSESIRVTQLDYSINFCSNIHDRYYWTYLLTGIISLSSRIISMDLFSQFIYSERDSSLELSFFDACINHYDERRNINIILHYYYDYLSLTKKKERRKPHTTTTFNTDCSNYLMNDKMMPRRKSIAHTFTRMSVRC